MVLKIIGLLIASLLIIGLILMFYCVHKAPIYPDDYDL